jgi:hypothetical protein
MGRSLHYGWSPRRRVQEQPRIATIARWYLRRTSSWHDSQIYCEITPAHLEQNILHKIGIPSNGVPIFFCLIGARQRIGNLHIYIDTKQSTIEKRIPANIIRQIFGRLSGFYLFCRRKHLYEKT